MNGCADLFSADLDDRLPYWESADILLLTETRTVMDLDTLLPDFHVFAKPASTEGKAGEGILVAVRRSAAYSVQLWATDDSSIWVQIRDVARAHAPLFVAAVYLPPQGSRGLQRLSLEERLASLATSAASAAELGDALMGGDFNARIGRLPDATAVLDTALPAHRGVSDRGKTQHGKALLRFCEQTGLILCTGRINGDLEAAPTFRERSNTRPTRLDHLLATPQAAVMLQSCSVNQQQLGSDHKPLEAEFRPPFSTRMVRGCSGCAGSHSSSKSLQLH